MAISAALVGARGTSTSNTVTTTAGTSTGGAGTIFYLVVSFDPGVTISTVSDSKGNTYSIIGSVVSGGANIARYKCEGGSGGGSHTATVTFSGTAYPTLHLIEISDAAAVSPLDVSATGTDSATPYDSVSTGSLAQADEVVIASIEQNFGAPGNYSETTGFTVLSQEPDVSNFWTSCVAALVVASTGSVTPSFTRTGNNPGAARTIIDTFKQSAGGGGAPVLMGQICI